MKSNECESAITWLATAAAGFIGMNASLRLLKSGDRVIGLDKLNYYYDVSLKQSRLAKLQSHVGFSLHQWAWPIVGALPRYSRKRSPNG